MTPRIHNFFSLVPKYKILLGSFIFLSLYSGALYTFATTYVSPGTTLDPLGIPGSYTVTPPLTYGGAVTSGHDSEVTYIDESGNLVSDSLFVRESSTGNFLVAQGFGPDEFANFQLNDSNQSAQMTYNNTVTGERAQVAAGGGPIQVDASYEDGVSIFGDLTIANGGNTLLWDADTNDDLSDVITQGQNLSGAGINGTIIGHVNLNTQEHAISGWGDFTGQGGQAFQAITSVGSGNVEVGHTVSPANGYQIQYQDVGTNTTAHLTLDGNANILWFDADNTDTISYGLEQDENIAGLGVFAGSANYYQDTSSNLVAISGSGDGTTLGLDPAMSFMGTLNPVTNNSAFAFTDYNVAATTMLSVIDVINGDKESSIVLDKNQSAISFEDVITNQRSALSVNGGAIGFGYTLDGTTQYIAVLGDGLFTVADNTNHNDYFKIDIPNQKYKLGDIDTAGNGTVMNILDDSKEIYAKADYGFYVQDTSSHSWFRARTDPSQHIVSLGDVDGVGNNTSLVINDLSKLVRITTGTLFEVTDSSGSNTMIEAHWELGAPRVLIGDNSGFNNQTQIEVDDGNQAITFNYNSDSYTFPIGDGPADYVLATDGAGQLFWQDPTLIPSDQTLKSNIAPSTYGLSTLLQLNPVSYTLNANNKQQIGFIAQEVEPLIPELIGEIAGGKKGLAYGQLSAVIVKSIQELDLKIKPLEDLMTSENTFASVLRNWLANTGNGITAIFSQSVHTDELCVGTTCVTPEQFLHIVEQANQGGSGTTTGGGNSDSGSSTSGDTGSTTDTTGTTSSGSGDTGGDTTTTGGESGTTSGESTTGGSGNTL